MSEAGDEGMLAKVLTKLTDMMGVVHAQQGDFKRTMTAVLNFHSDQLTAQVAGNVEF